jgi:hypothetical protein
LDKSGTINNQSFPNLSGAKTYKNAPPLQPSRRELDLLYNKRSLDPKIPLFLKKKLKNSRCQPPSYIQNATNKKPPKGGMGIYHSHSILLKDSIDENFNTQIHGSTLQKNDYCEL